MTALKKINIYDNPKKIISKKSSRLKIFFLTILYLILISFFGFAICTAWKSLEDKFDILHEKEIEEIDDKITSIKLENIENLSRFENFIDFVILLPTPVGSQEINKIFKKIKFHFLIGIDGSVYKGLGFHFVGNFPGILLRKVTHNSLVIMLMGDLGFYYPTQKSLKIVKKIIEVGLQRGHIHPNYIILGQNSFPFDLPANYSQNPNLGLNLYNIITAWPRWNSSPFYHKCQIWV